MAPAKKLGRKEIRAKGLPPERLEDLTAARAIELKRCFLLVQSRYIMDMLHDSLLKRLAWKECLEHGLYPQMMEPCMVLLKARWCLQGYLDPDMTLRLHHRFSVVADLIASMEWEMMGHDET